MSDERMKDTPRLHVCTRTIRFISHVFVCMYRYENRNNEKFSCDFMQVYARMEFVNPFHKQCNLGGMLLVSVDDSLPGPFWSSISISM